MASAEARALGLVVAATDLLPPELRYGRLRSITRRLSARIPLPVVQGHVAPAEHAPLTEATAPDGPRVTLVASRLDMGGLENVVRMLAEGLRSQGIATSVLCGDGGVTFDALAAAGVDVVVATTAAEAFSQLGRLTPDVIEVHSAPEHLMQAVSLYGAPWVNVIHNTEIHRRASEWDAVARSGAARWIAVSERARAFHVAHLGGGSHPEVVVVPNAAPSAQLAGPPRADARRSLGEATGWALTDDDVVVVSLSRYDAQKNVPGLVAGFAAAATTRPSLKLVVAGPPSDGLEVAWADALRRASRAPGNVALLGPSSSAVLLAAADAFMLDSFFEGWPLVVIEAVRAGLPIIVSDFGVVDELLRDGVRGVLIPNPATAGTIDDISVRRARRRVTSQRNASEFRRALVEVADRVDDWRARRPALTATAAEMFTNDEMIQGHAHWLKSALMTDVHP